MRAPHGLALFLLVAPGCGESTLSTGGASADDALRGAVETGATADATPADARLDDAGRPGVSDATPPGADRAHVDRDDTGAPPGPGTDIGLGPPPPSPDLGIGSLPPPEIEPDLAPPPPPAGDAAVEPPPPPPPSEEPPWQPPGPIAEERVTLFYQFTGQNIPDYADLARGLPQSPDHVYVFSLSHAQANASRELADIVHQRPDFRYAPAFDLNSRDGWRDADDNQLRAWADEYRDELLLKHADMFAFNEIYTDTPENEGARTQLIRLLGHLAAPDAMGRRLRGIVFFTEQSITRANWAVPANAFWERVDEVADLVVAEHFHGQGFVCDNTLDFLREHYFSMRDWLNQSGNAAKERIANVKFTVMHSARYGQGPSGWQGADSDVTTLAEFQRALSRASLATRTRGGGFNRIAYSPIGTNVTDNRVHPRIWQLVRWHYDRPGNAEESNCIENFPGNCECP